MREIETPTLIFPFFFRSFIFLFFLLVGGVRFSSIPAGGAQGAGRGGEEPDKRVLNLTSSSFFARSRKFPPLLVDDLTSLFHSRKFDTQKLLSLSRVSFFSKRGRVKKSKRTNKNGRSKRRGCFINAAFWPKTPVLTPFSRARGEVLSRTGCCPPHRTTF